MGRLTSALGVEMETGGVRRLNRSSPSCLNTPAQRTDFFHGLVVDYVVVHELVHLRHSGHGRDYWQAVGRVMPGYEGRPEHRRQRGVRWAW